MNIGLNILPQKHLPMIISEDNLLITEHKEINTEIISHDANCLASEDKKSDSGNTEETPKNPTTSRIVNDNTYTIRKIKYEPKDNKLANENIPPSTIYSAKIQKKKNQEFKKNIVANYYQSKADNFLKQKNYIKNNSTSIGDKKSFTSLPNEKYIQKNNVYNQNSSLTDVKD